MIARLVYGNAKLPTNWAIFNLPPLKTCPWSTPACRRTCYDLKACKMYPNVLPAREHNFQCSQGSGFIDDICKQITSRRNPVKVFRIHSGGDFYSIAYFKKWLVIADRNPAIQFFAFTKHYDLFKLSRSDNFRLIASVYYDEKRTPPKHAPVFETVRKGDTGTGQQCSGLCENCGLCPWISDDAQVWAEEH